MTEGTNLDLDIKEIYRDVCPKCKKRIEALIRQAVTRRNVDQVVKEILGK